MLELLNAINTKNTDNQAQTCTINGDTGRAIFTVPVPGLGVMDYTIDNYRISEDSTLALFLRYDTAGPGVLTICQQRLSQGSITFLVANLDSSASSGDLIVDFAIVTKFSQL